MFTVATAWWSLDIALYNIKLQLILGQTTSLSDLGVARVRIAQQYLPLANVRGSLSYLDLVALHEVATKSSHV